MSAGSHRLQRRVQGVRVYLTRRAHAAAALWMGTILGGVLLVSWVLAGPDGWRQGSNLPLALDAFLLVGLGTALWGVRRGARRWFTDSRLAQAMEGASGLRAGEVRGSLELCAEVPSGVSVSLAGLAADRVSDGLGGSPAELGGSMSWSVRRWTAHGARVLTALALVLGFLGVSRPTRTLRAWAGLTAPFPIMVDPVLPALELSPGTVEVQRGSDVEVSLRAPGRGSAELRWQAAGDVARSDVLLLDGSGEGRKTFEAVSTVVEYRARTPDGATTPTYRIVPVDPLFVSDVRLEVAYPPHTGYPPEEFRGIVPPLSIPVGTRITVEGTASRSLSKATLEDASGTAVSVLTRNGGSFAGSWRPRRSGVYTWSFLDDDGQPAVLQPEPLELTLLQDSLPTVDIPLPGRDTILPLGLRQPLIIQAQDDYGLRRLELVAFRVSAFGEVGEPTTRGIDLGGTRAALARPLLDVSGWGLLPGDEVRYFARVVDNAPVGQISETRQYVLRMPNADELRRSAEAQLEDVAARLEELAEEAAQQSEENRDLQRQVASQREEERRPGRPEPERELGFEEREELRAALEGQEELTGQVDSLQSELRALEDAMREAGQADPELARDLEELQELLEQIASEKLRQQMEELASALEQQDVREANQALEDMASAQEEFRDRLEASLERFRRAAVEQDFRATESEADELARQERALADALREEDAPELRAQQQQMLEERADELRDRMERLQERLEQLDEQDAAREVQEAGNRTQESQEAMDEARRRAQEERSQDAAETADQAAESMDAAAEQLREAQQQMAEQKAEAAQQALMQAADDALALARRQSALRGEMEGASQERVSGLRGDVASLVEGVRNLAQNLQVATEGASGGTRELSAQMGRAMESLQRTIDAMESRRGSSPSPMAAADQAVDDLNQLALMALAGAEQMSQQGQGQGGEQTAEQLQQLAQQQGELFNQTGQLTPLQLGEQAMREQLQQISQEQQSIADELQDLGQGEKSEEETLGDLDALAQEAQLLAEQLAQGRLTPDMMQRQERLFHRLLDAGRSLEDDEEISDERESETPGFFERADVLPLGPGELGVLRYRIPDAEGLQRLPPAVRQLVIQYFERLNRRGESGSSPGGRG
ncbi:MAG: hypothetical protein P8170_01795 [Gemmatimonadota bacterium]